MISDRARRQSRSPGMGDAARYAGRGALGTRRRRGREFGALRLVSQRAGAGIRATVVHQRRGNRGDRSRAAPPARTDAADRGTVWPCSRRAQCGARTRPGFARLWWSAAQLARADLAAPADARTPLCPAAACRNCPAMAPPDSWNERTSVAGGALSRSAAAANAVLMTGAGARLSSFDRAAITPCHTRF